MAVSNGQLANQTTFNDGFMSRTQDDNTKGVKSLESDTASSGPYVTDPQRDINGLNSFTGRTSNDVYNSEPTWTNNDVGTSGDNLKERAEALTDAFDSSTGHDHDGSTGSGGVINASNLSGLNYFRAVYQTLTVTSSAGTSQTVTTEFTGKTAGGNDTTAGVITTAPNNRLVIVDADTETAIEDAGGQRVYGRITESGGTWTLSYYTNEAGVETAHSIAGALNLRLYFREVFTLATIPTIGADVGLVPSLDLTADIVDASATQRGLMNLLTQSFAGDKTFNNSLRVLEELYGAIFTDSATTGANQTLATPSTSIVRLTNASLTSIDGITAPSFAQFVALINLTAGQLTLSNDLGTAANRIITGTGADLVLEPDASVWLLYDTTSSRWRVVGGSGSGGAGGQFVVDSFTGTTITASEDGFQKWRYTGGSAQTITAIDPTAVSDGAVINILGTSNSNTITLQHTDASEGYLLNGDWVGYLGSKISLQWDVSLDRWIEVSRNGI